MYSSTVRLFLRLKVEQKNKQFGHLFISLPLRIETKYFQILLGASMQIGQTIPNIQLSSIHNSSFNTDELKGRRYLVTFFRFATCPFCNMRIAQLINKQPKMGENFEIVAIFESNIDHLKKHASKHTSKFPILADPERQYYKQFGVKKSFLGMLKGMIFRLPTALSGILKGYIPMEISSRFLIMPLSLLIDEKGIIQAIYHGKDEGDHMPIEQVIEFSHQTL